MHWTVTGGGLIACSAAPARWNASRLKLRRPRPILQRGLMPISHQPLATGVVVNVLLACGVVRRLHLGNPLLRRLTTASANAINKTPAIFIFIPFLSLSKSARHQCKKAMTDTAAMTVIAISTIVVIGPPKLGKCVGARDRH